MPSSASAGRIASRKQAACRCISSCATSPVRCEDFAGLPAAGGLDGEAGRHPAGEAGDADHEELVQVAREDRQEADPFEERQGGVLGEFQDALIEPQPALLAVEEAVVRQRRRLG